MNRVRFDMHCHTAEGSPDAKVKILDYIDLLKQRGFHGMLVTDHDFIFRIQSVLKAER